MPTLNGLYYDMTSVRISLQGIPIVEGLKDISWDRKVTATEITDNQAVKLGTGIGRAEFSATLTLQQETWEIIAPKLQALAVAKTGLAALTVLVFDIAILFVSPGNVNPTKIDINGCRIVGDPFGGITGNEGFTRQIALNVIEIIENGIRLAPARRLA